MGFFDRFRSTKGAERSKKAKHVVSKDDAKKAAVSAEEAKRAAFRSASQAQKPEAAAKAPTKRVLKDDTRRAYHVLLRPIVTEKSAMLSQSHAHYTFSVAPDANKLEIRKAVQAVYGVLPRRVTIRTVSGKAVRYGRSSGRTRSWKKAVVILAPGQKIDIGEG